MALEQRLSLKMAQKLVMTPSLQQAIKLLQMTRMELQGVLTQELVENPVLEEGLDAEDPVEEPNEQEEAESDDPMDDIDLEAYFNDYYEGSSHPSMAENKEAPPLENTLTHDPDLYDHLLWQLHMDPEVGARQRRLAELIIGNLDPDGLLVASPEEILALAVGSALPSEEEELDPEEIAQLAAAFELESNGTGNPGSGHGEGPPEGEETVAAEPSLATREISTEAAAALVEAAAAETPAASPRERVDDPELPEAIAAFAERLVDAAGESDEVMLDCTLEEVEEALALVRSFEPTGIACRNLQESLLLQLDARAREELGVGLDELDATADDGDGEGAVDDGAEDWPEVETYRQAREVIAEHWKSFMKRQYPAIAKALGIDLQDLRPAVDLIKGLDPHPGRRYSNERPQYIEPDVSVIKLGSEYVVQVSDDGMPRLRVSRAYRRMLQEMRQAGRHGDAQSFIKDNTIVETLNSFHVSVVPGDITKGPTITRYEVLPSTGLRVSKITALKADLARATRAERINILAPIPGKDTVGIEIANSNKITVPLRELFEGEAFRDSRAKLPLVLGKDVYGKTVVGDLAKMPHLLVAGATGSGKSVCINSIIASLLYRFTPDQLKFIMIDPKVVEMQLYNDLPHMVVPVVTDPKKVLLALRWVITEMERRYELFAGKGTRNFDNYNDFCVAESAGGGQYARSAQPDLFDSPPVMGDTERKEEEPEPLPYIVVIIDELADLMQTAPADVETGIARIAQKARAAGIHLIVATQTPRADVVTGIIKANIPSRIAFQVSSKTDSRIILDENGAENLVGKGDMLYLPPGSAQLVRAQGALITDEEAAELVRACAAQGSPAFEEKPDQEVIFGEQDNPDGVSDADEEIIAKCMEVIFSERKASTSLLQRRLRLGYTRAARMIDILENRGIIGPGDGAKAREILVDISPE